MFDIPCYTALHVCSLSFVQLTTWKSTCLESMRKRSRWPRPRRSLRPAPAPAPAWERAASPPAPIIYNT